MTTPTLHLRLIVGSLCLLMLFSGKVAQGATQTVTNTNDSGAGSLRQAIATATTGDRIHFDSSLSGQTLTVLTRLPLTKNLTIDGTALETALTIDGNHATQLFAVHEGTTATITGFTLANANANFGGAIYNQGTLTITRVTFVDNQALQGGAIYNIGSLTVENSTFHGNAAFNGGALSNLSPATMRNSTLIANSSFNPGGGIDNAGELTLYNTIIAGSTYGEDSTSGGDCVNEENPQLGLHGTLTAHANNLVEDGGCEAMFTGDPSLSALETVDGALVYVPLTGSPVIDAGDNASCATTDQRALLRPQGEACDLGAIEWLATRLMTDTLITEEGLITHYNAMAAPCTDQPTLHLPTHTITPTLRNHSSEHVRDLYFVITELRYTAAQGNHTPTLCNADGGQGGGVDATLTVTLTGTLADQILAPGEPFTQPFAIGLPVRARYRIAGKLYGTPTVTATPQRTNSQPLGMVSWEFDEAGNLVDKGASETDMQIFLPVVAR